MSHHRGSTDSKASALKGLAKFGTLLHKHKTAPAPRPKIEIQVQTNDQLDDALLEKYHENLLDLSVGGIGRECVESEIPGSSCSTDDTMTRVNTKGKVRPNPVPRTIIKSTAPSDTDSESDESLQVTFPSPVLPRAPALSISLPASRDTLPIRDDRRLSSPNPSSSTLPRKMPSSPCPGLPPAVSPTCPSAHGAPLSRLFDRTSTMPSRPPPSPAAVSPCPVRALFDKSMSLPRNIPNVPIDARSATLPSRRPKPTSPSPRHRPNSPNLSLSSSSSTSSLEAPPTFSLKTNPAISLKTHPAISLKTRPAIALKTRPAVKQPWICRDQDSNAMGNECKVEYFSKSFLHPHRRKYY